MLLKLLLDEHLRRTFFLNFAKLFQPSSQCAILPKCHSVLFVLTYSLIPQRSDSPELFKPECGKTPYSLFLYRGAKQLSFGRSSSNDISLKHEQKRRTF